MDTIIHNMRKIIVTGGVAVGKTTIVNNMMNTLDLLNVDYIFIPEYIDGDQDKAQQKLCDYLNGSLSPFDFQSYTIQFYESYLESLDVKGNELLIFERAPDDSIICFAKRNYEDGIITNQEYEDLKNIAHAVNVKFNIPSYVNYDACSVAVHIINNTNIDDVNFVITNLITNTSNNMIIGLDSSPTVCYERMKQRNRPGEVDAYNQSVIERFNGYYDDLYNMLISKS